MKLKTILYGFVLFLNSIIAQNVKTHQKPILTNIRYEVFKGEFEKTPDFQKLKPLINNTAKNLDAPIIEQEKYAIRFTGEIHIVTDGFYKFFAFGGIDGNFSIGSNLLFKFDSDHVKSKTTQLKKGVHSFELSYVKNSWKSKPLRFKIEPDYLIVNENIFDKKHWLFFGWEEDHPKAISLMGGALYPRRPQLLINDDFSWKHSLKPWHKNSSDIILFMLGVDGSPPFYPNETSHNRKKEIQWGIAEDYLPSPTSKWKKDKIDFKIQHFGRRVLDNKANVVYTAITLLNTDSKPHKTTLTINGNFVNERVFTTNKIFLKSASPHKIEIDAELKSNESRTYNFVIPANGEGTPEEILEEGGFKENYSKMKHEIDLVMKDLTQPTSLPNKELINLWKSSMPNMWIATVKTPIDLEQRGSGGNVAGFYQYDRTFDHDVPDMVIQYILEGRNDLAKQIMEGAVYERLSQGILAKEKYLDAVPKYLITMAQYLQITGDKAYFTKEIMQKIKSSAKGIHKIRERQLDSSLKGKGAYGLVDKSSTLDNGNNYLVVDNFAALHGLAAYKYINEQLNNIEEAKWAEAEIVDLNQQLNKALDLSMKAANVDWYNACFSFDNNERLLSGPGNWLGTTLMMPSFPWNAYLKGFNHGGTWKTYFDNSIKEMIQQSLNIDNPDGSLGAWWGAKYGAIYNAGMAMSFLYSDHYRSDVVKYIEWLIEKQSVPYQWGESFLKPKTANDWTVPVVDLETWGLGFMRQALLQICVSNHADGTVILGRGIPNRWLNTEKEIAWKNVRINNGKKINLSIVKEGKQLNITIDGDIPDGKFLVDIPIMVNNVTNIKTNGKLIDKNLKKGKIWFSANTKNITLKLKK